ncbi:MAG: hypothetical protein N2Z22_09290 [Turneriella sp.]|nr:hypothetical protein [Turneriella sp.]
MVYDKAAGGKRVLSYTDIVQECLCFGFIDSLPRRVSDTQSSLYISRRKPKSEWSKINKEHVAELIRKKIMHPAGLAVVERAKADGS